MRNVLADATAFLHANARLLERRLFATRFHGASPEHVVTALLPYRNPDGGFGHGLEPDLRAPASQPICTEFALQTLFEAGARDDALASGACAFLASIATADGAVSPVLAGGADTPCADHWQIPWAVTPGVNPTATLAAWLFALGVQHPWIDRAAKWCLDQIERERFGSAHTLRGALLLLEHVPDRDRADGYVDRLMDQLGSAGWFTVEVPITTYTQTPLHFAPRPDAPLRSRFEDAVIDAHLDDLVARQEDDGGWPVFWQPPGPGALQEWRGRWTLEAVMTLRAYGRI